MIEDIDFPSVNRSLITIELKQPYIDWANEIRDQREIDSGIEFDLVSLNEDVSSYLINEVVRPGDFDAFLKNYWKILFELQLSGWILDESIWPQKRTKKMFDEWFNVNCNSLVIDLCGKEPLGHQD